MESVIVLNDFHAPYHDPKAVKVALKLAKHIKPKIAVIHEINDFYALSRFDKDPKRRGELQEELDIGRKIRAQIRKALPKTRIIEVESNHTKRLKKYLRTTAPELDCLRCLKFEKLAGLKDYGIEFKDDFVFRDVLFKHGNTVRKDSSYSAKAEFVKEGMSGASGHTHRLGTYFKTLRGGKYVWMETGHLSEESQAEYISGTANWQQGLGIFMFKNGKKHFQPKLVPIINHEILWGSHLFKA